MTDSYEDVAYPSRAWMHSHPARIAALAMIAGLDPPPLERWRVLELGCGDAANLLPMAMDFPDARFVGVDRACRPLQRAARFAGRLDLRNLQVCTGDLLDWRPEGEFDYIIAHGVYSWVPRAVRENMLEICGAHLTPQGIAYISYNALPGCHFRRFAWDLTRFHTRLEQEAGARIEGARQIAKLILEQPGEDPVHAAIRGEFQTVLERDPLVLFHDDLSETNDPFYLSEFVEQAERHGLQYLGDAEPLRDNVRDLPVHSGDWLADCQYADFLAARRFRKSLVCRAGIALERVPHLERFHELFAASAATAGALQPDGAQRFEFGKGGALTTNHPLPRAVLCRLGSLWPGSLRVAELPLSGFPPEQAADLLMRLVEGEAIELRACPPRLSDGVSEHPAASPLARLQIAEALSTVTNQRHQTIELADEIARKLVALLDGKHDRAALARALPSSEDVLEGGLRGLYRLCLLRD